jgi:hypothetical protein
MTLIRVKAALARNPSPELSCDFPTSEPDFTELVPTGAVNEADSHGALGDGTIEAAVFEALQE